MGAIVLVVALACCCLVSIGGATHSHKAEVRCWLWALHDCQLGCQVPDEQSKVSAGTSEAAM